MAPGSISEFLAQNLFAVLIAVLVLNLVQRRYQNQAQKKRLASLLFAILILLLMGASATIQHFLLRDLVLLPVILLLAATAYLFRRHFFPFSLHCRKCGKKLQFKTVLFFDSNCCEECCPQSPGGGDAPA